MSKISLLICGKLRDRTTFEADLEHYLEWLHSNVIDRIVFSGWASDLPAHSDLLHSLPRRGVEVILSDEPKIKTPGYVLHQAKSLHHGLTQLDPDALVLKTRTDKVSWSLGCDIKTLSEVAAGQRPVGPQSPFRERVLVLGALLFQPFFISDQLFLGKARDLKLIANYDLWYERDHCLLNTEQMPFYPAFRPNCPFTEAFFTVNPGLQFSRRDLVSDLYHFLLRQPLYQHVLREHMTALDTSFTLGLFGRDHPPVAMTTWQALLDNNLSIAGTYVPPDSGLRFGVSDKLPETLLDVPILEGSSLTLRDLDARSPNINQMRDDVCRGIFDRWPQLPNVRVPNMVTDGVQIVSSRISLIGS